MEELSIKDAIILIDYYYSKVKKYIDITQKAHILEYDENYDEYIKLQKYIKSKTKNI